MGWNIADAFEAIVVAQPEAVCTVQGATRRSWAETDRRADALAADMLEAGCGVQAKVAAYLQNSPEYLETYLAAFKARLVPVNTNFRYGPVEIAYLFDNADAEAVVFGTEYAAIVDEVRPQLSRVRRWYAVGPDVPAWAEDYGQVVERPAPQCRPAGGRSGDDLLLLYTGGTTGMPKGVMWPQADLMQVLRTSGNPLLGSVPVATLEELVATRNPLVTMPACPLMHGTGQFSSLVTLLLGGTVVLLPGGHFEAAALFDIAEAERVNNVIIVGDAFARPMLDALDASPDRWDLSSLRLITSSGVMWSHEVKAGLLGHLPHVALFDSLGSSEGVGFGASVTAAGMAASTAQFSLGPNVRVVTDDGRFIEPGSDEVGMLALSGPIPVGYYKDHEKSAATFRTLDGARCSIPGDYAMVNPDGTLQLLGRGSVCINTGGEKVFPEEVEEVLKRHPAVRDAVCLGLPDDRFGEIVAAVIEPAVRGVCPEPAELAEFAKRTLAAYKAPRRIVMIDTIGRAPNGKVDYRRLSAYATDRLK